MLTIVGLGPGSLDYLSEEARQVLMGASKLFVRTSWHPVLDELEGLRYESFDSLYEEADTFDDLYLEIAEKLIQLSKEEDIVYAVPGSPFMAERTVQYLLERDQVKIISGVSFLEPLLTSLRIDPVEGLLVIDALGEFSVKGDKHTVLLQVYSREVASRVKLALMEQLEDDRLITIIKWAGLKEELIKVVPLYELDHEDLFDHLTSLYIAPGERRKDYEALKEVTRRLRAPGGCPWDQEQTHESLKRYLLEECYEVMHAIDTEDLDALEDELGDLLFQAFFHAQIASEEGYFTIDDVVEGITEKLIRRHTHVFEGDSASNPEEVMDIWEKNKKKEKSIEERISGIPKVSPLHYAQKFLKLTDEKKESSIYDSEESLMDDLLELIKEANAKGVSLDMLLMDTLKAKNSKKA